MGDEVTDTTPSVPAADLVAAALADTPQTDSTPQTDGPVADNNSGGGHPAWQEILGVVPEVLHEKVKPTLQKWDSGVQEKLAEYTRTYDPYKPIIESGASVDELLAGRQLMQLLNDDPAKFYDAMRDHYKFGDNGQGDTSSADTVDLEEFADVDVANHPKIKELAKQQEQMLATFQAQQAEAQQRESEKWLSTKQSEITDQLKEKNLEPDWDYILNKAYVRGQTHNDLDKALTEATADYVKMVEKYRAPVANLGAPPVLSPSGTVPISSDSKSLKDDTTRKTLLAQALKEALRE